MSEIWFMNPNGFRIDPDEDQNGHGDIADSIINNSRDLSIIFNNICRKDTCYNTALNEKVFGYPKFLLMLRICKVFCICRERNSYFLLFKCN